MTLGMTPSEELVYRLCSKSFFSLWSYARPRGKKAKELCDVLVVCDPDVIVFSVKEVTLKRVDASEAEVERWRREAITESVKQIYGAERWLKTATQVVRADGSPGLPLPDVKERRVHRIAVALGSKGEVPFGGGDHGKGHVHVLDERGLDVLMQELDTITDFTDYLRAKESLLSRTRVLGEGEESLLAVYLRANRHFEIAADFMVVEGDHWESFSQEDWYKAKLVADRDSRAFDEIIERFSEPAMAGTLANGSTLSDTERIIRVMARETRLQRRVLGKCFIDFLRKSQDDPRGLARFTKSLSGVVYVFLAVPREIERELRSLDLQQRCIVARGLHKDSATVIGVATERIDGEVGVSLDGCCIHEPTWTEEHQREFDEIQSRFNYFVNAQVTRGREDEYPGSWGPDAEPS